MGFSFFTKVSENQYCTGSYLIKGYIHSKVLLFISKLFKQTQVIPKMLHVAERERLRHIQKEIFLYSGIST